jgi:transposase
VHWKSLHSQLSYKWLEKTQFCWPRIGHNRVQLNHAQLLAVIDGMDWKRVRFTSVRPPEFVG